MIENLLNEEVIEIHLQTNEWETVVRKSGELLLKAGKIEENYIESMVDTVKSMGAYIVIDKGLALPHGRPEEGVNEMGISIITLEEGVNFGNEEFDPVKLVVGICATDGKTHVELMGDLSTILDDEEFVEKCSRCKSKKEIIDLFVK